MKNLYLENARIIFRNFRGDAGQYNKNGDITFSVVLEEEDALRLTDEGWNIKRTKGNPDEGVEPIYHLPVTARFEYYPPKVYLIQDGRKIQLEAEDCAILDQVAFANVDLVIRPYEYHLPSGESGVKAYLSKGFFTEDMDVFDKKYAKYDTFVEE